MPIPNESAVTYFDQSEPDSGDFTSIENVFNGYSVVSGGLVTAQVAPDGTVAVTAGVAKVAAAALPIVAGNVSVISGAANPDSSTALAAHATQARFSLVVINSSGQLGVLHGSSAGLAPANDGSYLCVWPSFAGYTVLAEVFVPPTFTTVATAQVSVKRIIRTDGDFSARIISPTALSAAVNDYAPTGFSTANVVRLATNSGTQRNISGLVPTGHIDGGFVVLQNLGPGAIGLLDDTTSTAANRFALAGDIVLPVDKSVIIYYDATSSRWRAASGMTNAASPTAAVGTAAAAGTSPYALASDATVAHEPGHIAHDTAWAAKGDLIAATGNDAAAVVPVGANGKRLTADSTQASGVAWEAGMSGAVQADVLTSETTASTSYTDLATAGPDAAIVAGVSGKALVIVRAVVFNGAASSDSWISFSETGGAFTAADADGARLRASGANAPQVAITTSSIVTGLTPGSTYTFRMKYRVSANTGTFVSRRIIAFPL